MSLFKLKLIGSSTLVHEIFTPLSSTPPLKNAAKINYQRPLDSRLIEQLKQKRILLEEKRKSVRGIDPSKDYEKAEIEQAAVIETYSWPHIN